MLTRVYLDNFKSLIDFSFPPKKDIQDIPAFSCLVGLNGSGKSTILQAFDFLAQLPQGRIDSWLDKRGWKHEELTSKFTKKTTITFSISLLNQGKSVVWSGTYNKQAIRCTQEKVTEDDKTIFSVQDGKLNIFIAGESSAIPVKDLLYQGSILSVYKFDVQKAPAIAAIFDFSQGMKSLELLNPQLIKTRSRAADDVGIGGEKLTAFFHGLSTENKRTILTQLQEFYPHVTSILSSSLRAGWKTITVSESFENGSKNRLETETTHLNDGMLRILTIITQMQTNHTCLLLDEIENGMNPELVERLMDYLVNSKKQVIVTTHSPMVLNYLEDQVAQNGVFLVYRNEAGYTRCGRYFQSNRTREKLRLLGPGEVFVDTTMQEVSADLEYEFT